jgi:hypothetical protein
MIWNAAVALALALAPPPPQYHPAPTAVAGTAGDYLDRAGATHHWEITRAHSLIWDGKPYFPAGVVLHVPETGASQTRTAALSSTLDLLAAHGVKDLCLVRAGGWLAGDSASEQAMIDALEAKGLRYGIALDARPDQPLSGYLATPTRVEVPAEWRVAGHPLRCSVELAGAHSAVYALVDKDSDTVVASGRVPVTDGSARIEVPIRPSRRMFSPGAARLLVVPEMELGSQPEERPIDFWSGWEDTQQQLARRVAGIKWGPGLRFFVRPAPSTFGLHGEGEELVPASGGFRMQFESWLERHYSVADLCIQWGLNEREVSSLTEAARLVPLFGREEHDSKSGWLLDPVTAEPFRVDLRRSGFWRDFEQFRTDSIRRVIGSTATLLKKTTADVPVLWEWTEYHPIYTDPQEVGGVDGLAFAAQGWGRDAATGTAAYAFAQAEGSAKPTWFIQLGQHSGDSAPPASLEELRLDWNWLREIGCKGFYMDGLAVDATAGQNTTSTAAGPATGQPQTPTWELSSVPDRLDWIRDYGENVASGEAVASYRPSVIYFPSDAVGTSLTGRMANGVWWLPSFSRGRRLVLGEQIEGYWIDRAPDRGPAAAAPGVTVLWSTGAAQKATFPIPAAIPINVYDALGRPLKQMNKRGQLQVALGPDPIVVTGLPAQSLFPVETTVVALHQFETLIKEAEEQKINVSAFRLALSQAKSLFSPATAATTYDLIRTPLSVLRAELTPYIWIEGEAAARQNWSGILPDPHASAGGYLHLDRTSNPSGSVYQAQYGFVLEREATFEVWMAGSVPGSPDVSGFTWRVDDRAPSLVLPNETTRRYTTFLGWTQLGQVQLPAGRHTITFAVTEPAHNGGYHLDLDALVLSRVPFRPDGVRRPPFRLAQDIHTNDTH